MYVFLSQMFVGDRNGEIKIAPPDLWGHMCQILNLTTKYFKRSKKENTENKTADCSYLPHQGDKCKWKQLSAGKI